MCVSWKDALVKADTLVYSHGFKKNLNRAGTTVSLQVICDIAYHNLYAYHWFNLKLMQKTGAVDRTEDGEFADEYERFKM